ncbi:MAG: hypothetical protein HZA16_15185 [Nitrospirae bacterium]|nr:hypothetical protein [Nitrospirota bacterium]
MTTVINLNFLNFFRLRVNNNITLNNDARSYNQYLDNRRQYYSSEQDGFSDVIDITPYSPAIVDNRDNTGSLSRETEKRHYFTNPAKVENTYNHKGKTVQLVDSKGLLIDSYA